MLHYMPPEWYRHEATVLTWPHDASIWRGLHEQVETTFVELASRLSTMELVYINVPDAEWEARVLRLLRREGADMQSIRPLLIPSNDVWARDHGPTVVFRHNNDGTGERVLRFPRPVTGIDPFTGNRLAADAREYASPGSDKEPRILRLV